MKSKSSATTIRDATIPSSIARLPVLDDDAFEHVGYVFAAVGGILEEVEHLLPLDHGDRILLLVEQPAEGLVMNPVGLVLEPVHLHGQHVYADTPLERLESLPELPGRLGDRPRQLPSPETNRADAISPDDAGRGIDGIHHVVERGRQGMDVLAVDRSDEGAVEPLKDLMRDRVAALFDALDLGGDLP